MVQAGSKSLAIIGAGPVGLAAGAHALARGLRPVILEAGAEAGHAVKAWGHVAMFSPWEFNIDREAGRLLAGTGWVAPPAKTYPTGAEFEALYLRPLATATPLAGCLRTGARVTAISRVGFDKVRTRGRAAAAFILQITSARGMETVTADAVIDASGTWSSPNPAGANGVAAMGEQRNAARISFGMPDVRTRDRARYAGRSVAVVGAGHSAIGTLIDLVRLKQDIGSGSITWLIRGDRPDKSFGGGANDKLAARGELGAAFARVVASGQVQVEAGFGVTHVSSDAGKLRIGAGSACCGRHVMVDELIVATGFRPDFSFARELRLALDPALECSPALAPLIDPNEHSCGTVRPHGARELAHPETGFYVAGMKSYGRAPTFLAMTGYEQVRSIVAEIAGDHDAAARVELVLPETGVCSGPGSGGQAACCEPAEAVPPAAGCCAPKRVAEPVGA